MEEINFGGSCHWCTEAVFASLKGVEHVSQGWIASSDAIEKFSEAVIVKFDPSLISLEVLIAVHLHTHSSTSLHSMRSKYRSAVYCMSQDQEKASSQIISNLQSEFSKPIITEVVPFGAFKLNKEEYLNYYFSDPSKPFCENVVNPKLKELMKRFSKQIHLEKLTHLDA